MGFCHGFATVGALLASIGYTRQYRDVRKWFRMKRPAIVGA
jgi:hypothetical protein